MIACSRRTGCAGFSGAALGFFIALPGLVAADAESEAIRRRAREVVSSGRYQSTLRFDAADPSAEALASERSARDGRGGRFRLESEAIGGVATLLLYAIFAVAAALVFVWVVRVLGERSALRERWSRGSARPRLEKQRGVVESRPARGEPTDHLREVDHLGEADRLAASGDYDEAAHQILLGAIEHLGRTESFESKDSFTSREIASALRLDEPRTRAFRDLVLAVEESIFRGRPMTQARFDLCRDRLETLRQGEST